VFAVATLVWLLLTQTSADADLWGHLRFGLDLLSTHALPRWDPYSFTTDRVWVNHEWLSELTMAAAYQALGPLGLNLIKLIAIGIVATIVIVVARREHAPWIDCVILCTLVVLATYTRTQVIRPQLFSVPLFCVILYALTEAEHGRFRAVMFLPVLFALWVNLHGAWIVGLACVGCWLAVTAWTTRDKRAALVALGIATVLATLVNPYGLEMWRFLAETVRPQRHDVTDWKPLFQLPAGIIVLDLLLPAIAACAIILGRQRVAKPHAAVIAVLAFATWRIGRVDAFLEAAVGILLAPQILRGFESIRTSLTTPIWRRPIPGARLIILAGSVAAFIVGLRHTRTIDLEGAWLPDSESTELMKQTCAHENVLTWFDWGEYAIWHLSPAGIRVSMDGRRETVYSPRVLENHQAFYDNDRLAIDYPDRIAAQCVWLPTRLGAVASLQRHGWVIVARTASSAILRRSPVTLVAPITTSGAKGPRVFPGP
jgi:hypothetical protein